MGSLIETDRQSGQDEMEVWTVVAANSSSEEMFIHLGGVYSVVTIFCNLFLIAVILSKAELRGQRDSFFMVSLSVANVLVGFAFTSKILRDEDTDSWPHHYVQV